MQCECLKKKRSSKKWDKLQGLSWNAGEIHIYRKSPQLYPTLAEPLAQSQTFHFGLCSCSGPNAGCISVSNHYTRQLMLITTWPTNCTTWKTGCALLWLLLWTSGSYLGFPFIGTPGNWQAPSCCCLINWNGGVYAHPDGLHAAPLQAPRLATCCLSLVTYFYLCSGCSSLPMLS